MMVGGGLRVDDVTKIPVTSKGDIDPRGIARAESNRTMPKRTATFKSCSLKSPDTNFFDHCVDYEAVNKFFASCFNAITIRSLKQELMEIKLSGESISSLILGRIVIPESDLGFYGQLRMAKEDILPFIFNSNRLGLLQAVDLVVEVSQLEWFLAKRTPCAAIGLDAGWKDHHFDRAMTFVPDLFEKSLLENLGDEERRMHYVQAAIAP